MQFRRLAGNEGLKRQLSGNGTLPHAIVISGAPGSGRHTAAQEIAQAMVCAHPYAAPCENCPNCRKVRQGIHPDVMQLERFLESGDESKELRVYAVRAIREDAQIRPNEADCKVYIIDRPMNPQAQNAILKLLEEGPAYARFLIVVENGAALLETVRSRCAQLHTTPLSQGQVLTWLRGQHPDAEEDTLREAAHVCDGRLGAAEAYILAGAQESESAPYTASWVQALASRDEFALMRCVAQLQSKKISRDTADAFYAELMEVTHQALVQPYVGSELPKTLEEQSAQLRQSYTPTQLMELYALMERARQMGKSNVAAVQSAAWLAVKSVQL